MTGKEYLNDLRKMNTEIDVLLEQIEMLRQEADGLRSMELSDMPKGGKGQDMGDAVATLVDLQRKHYDLVLDRMLKREKAMIVISRIDKSEQRTVLTMRYIMGRSWDDIVDKTHYAYSGIFKLHGQALVSFEKEWSKVELEM